MTSSRGATDAISTSREPAERWLRDFSRAVRDRDYVGARDLCRDDVTGFGTVTTRYRGIDELLHEQWSNVWDRTEGFSFDVDSAVVWADGSLTVVISEWSSVGVQPDGTRRPRHGRATLALAGTDEGLRAVHTHFSMAPGFTA